MAGHEGPPDDILPPAREVKLKSPWVAVGCVATSGALLSMIYASHKGHTNLFQMSMRARVALQGLTVAVMAASSGFLFRDKIPGLSSPPSSQQ